MDFEVFIGWDPREALAWRVACASLQLCASKPVAVRPIWRQQLEQLGLYRRAHTQKDNVSWDVISDAPCSTEFSIARFGVPLLARSKVVLFVDVDFLFRDDVWELYDSVDSRHAVSVVKHKHRPSESAKMDGQIQRQYERKNWSSCMLWNMRHQANRGDWYAKMNTWHRDRLHQLCWLQDEEIGDLPSGEAWNWLDGHSSADIKPKAVHFTRGTPDMAGYEHTRYAPEWNRYAQALIPRGRNGT